MSFISLQLYLKFEQEPKHGILHGSLSLLKKYKILIATIVVLSLIILPLGWNIIRAPYYEEDSDVIYQSPEGGETIDLDTWRCEEFVISVLGEYSINQIGISFEILDWGHCPPSLDRYHFAVHNLRLDQFESLNETAKEDVASSHGRGITPDEDGGYSSGTWNEYTFEAGNHLWGIKFLPSEGYEGQGSLIVKIKITLNIDYNGGLPLGF